jgi:hypothetical protein
MYTLNGFDSDRKFTISQEDLNENFYEGIVENDIIINACISIPLKEWSIRQKVTKLKSELNKFIKKIENKQLQKLLIDKKDQLFQTQGSTKCITIKQYEEYYSNQKKFSKLEEFGNPVYNRNSCRWGNPNAGDITREDYKKSKSYPCPIGIRAKDFAFPSDVLKTVKELLNQIYNMKNIPQDEYNKAVKAGIITPLKLGVHTCRFCGESPDLKEYEGVYKSAKNYLEICHRDWRKNFTDENMYFGHGECNRKQGGNSEAEVIEMGMKLIKLYPEKYGHYLKSLNT